MSMYREAAWGQKHLETGEAVDRIVRGPLAKNPGMETFNIRALVRAFLALGSVVTWLFGPLAVLRMTALGRQVEGYDLMIGKGGTYLYTQRRGRDAVRLAHIMLPFIAAVRLNVPVVLLGHTIGPFECKTTGRLVRWVCSRVSIVYREEESLRFSSGSASGDVALWAVDRVGGSGNWEARSSNGDGGKWIIIPRAFGNEYYQAVESAVDYWGRFVEENGQNISSIVVMVQSCGPGGIENDTEVAQRLGELLAKGGWDVEIEGPFRRLAEAMALLGQADRIASDRFHGALLGLIAGIPAFCRPYFGTKAEGTYRDLGREAWLLSADDASACPEPHWGDTSARLEHMRQQVRLALEDAVSKRT